MENRPKTTTKIAQVQKGKQQKFKNLNIEYNELQSKYDIYKNGTPNNYKQDVQSLKAYNIKNNIKTLELPSIDYLLQEIKNIPENTGTNQRDYNIHPSILHKYGSKFKNMISDHQEIKDFTNWFNSKQKEIEDRKDHTNTKFYLLQNLIGSGFSQIVTQLSSISKPRSQILRTLWNKQNNEFEKIINLLHKQSSDLEKNNLQTIRSLHIGYQQQIIDIKNKNFTIEKKNQEANILNESCINTLRTMRKQLKKYEKIIKQLNESNYYLKEESLKLLEENINLLMKQNNISFEKARILCYQKLYLSSMKKELADHRKTKNIIKDTKGKAENLVDNSQFHDLQQKKQKLLKFIKNRLKANPTEKMYILKGQFSQEQDEQIVLEQNIEEMLKSKEYRLEMHSRVAKIKAAFFKEASTNTQLNQPNASIQNKISIGVQTIQKFEKQMIDFLTLNKKEEQEDKKKLRDKKVLQRHTLMMIEMNKMMEFKKIDNANKIRRLSKFSKPGHSRSNSNESNFNSTTNGVIMESGSYRYNSLDDSERNISEQSVMEEEKQEEINFNNENKMEKLIDQGWEKNYREENIKKRHHQSLFLQKSSQFQSMINRLSKEMPNQDGTMIKRVQYLKQKEKLFVKQQEEQSQAPSQQLASTSTFSYSDKEKKKIQIKQSKFRQMYKNENEEQKVEQFKDLVKKYIEKKGQNREQINNPQKHLKKILTDTFKNLFVSKKTNFLKQLIKTSKNSYGKMVYQNKLIHLISMIIQNKQKSLLAALGVLLNICGYEQNFIQINDEDTNELYFKIYFNLCMKNPTENQFNIWNNYTNIQKLNNQAFADILKMYFHDNKCVYLQLKIREFIGFTSNDQINSNYYVQLNPLMMYIVEVYLSEKKNYYESYHQILDFLVEGNHMDLQTFIFLLDLLCFKQEQQRQLVEQYFDKQCDEQSNLCSKDVFYRICVKYEVPLFQFIKILKFEQFKKLHDYIQNDYIDINDSIKWHRLKDNLQKKLRSKNKYGIGLKKVIEKLDNYIEGSYKIQNEPFLFFYRIIIFIAFGDIQAH